MKKLYTIIDFETTGLNFDGEDQITEMYALKVDEDGKEIGSFHTFVQLDNGKPISEYTPHITEELCSQGLPEYIALAILGEFTQGTTVVAQNAPFDFSFLDWQPMSFICTRALTFLIEPKGTNPSLAPTCERHGIKIDNHHQAESDVRATKEVLFLMMKKAEEAGIYNYENAVIDFIDRPLIFKPAYANVFKELQ